jgi:hypothetical protein
VPGNARITLSNLSSACVPEIVGVEDSTTLNISLTADLGSGNHRAAN